MTTDAQKAIELTDSVEKKFSESLRKLTAAEQSFALASKKASGSVRESTTKLSEGLLRIEKAANFDKLERYVELLERAAKAIDILGDLEKSGRLAKIADAIK
ncbi:MAG: hypothetical protein Q8Q50_02740 [Methylobacter sp.]|nr:hypothetical protein [Methylobacter sp.]